MVEEQDPPWLSKTNWGTWEINTMGNGLTVNCSVNEVIEIDKLYGPLSATGVRVRLEFDDKYTDWVVEREKLSGGAEDSQWIEMARWDCQMDWPKK